MITSPQNRIDEYTANGWWGTETLHHLVEKTFNVSPERLAVADPPNKEALTGLDNLRLNYAQLNYAADNLAEQFLRSGVVVEEKLIVQLPNVVELVVTYLAASKLGAIVSPVPVQYGQHELESISKVLKAKTIVSCSQFKGEPLASIASGLNVLYFGKGLEGGDDQEGGSGTTQLQINTNANSTQALDAHRLDHSSIIDDANSIYTICWTSGTTGTPKGVPRSHNMWIATARSEVTACDFRPGDHFLNPFPLINMAAIGGFLFPWAKFGSTLFLHHPLDAGIYLQQLQQEKITFTIAPPALLNQLAQSPDNWNQFDFAALRRIGSGSAPLAPAMIETFSSDYGKEIINFYGSNEGICLLSDVETASTPEQRASMFPRLGFADLPWKGEVFEFAKTKVVDTNSGDEIHQAGMSGELLFAGPTIFDGYYDVESHGDVFSEDGYFRTGDLVEICGEGERYYRIVGRCKDIINRGGMKLSPSELDQLLEGYSGLQEVAVCAYPDERLSEKVCACVVAKDGEKAPKLSDLTDYLIEQGVAKYKLPERIEVFEQLPRNPMGKVLRFELSDLVAERD